MAIASLPEATEPKISKQYGNLGYNKAALAFTEAGGNDTKNSGFQAVNAVIAISPDDKLLLPCHRFPHSGVPINGNLWDWEEIVEQYRHQ